VSACRCQRSARTAWPNVPRGRFRHYAPSVRPLACPFALDEDAKVIEIPDYVKKIKIIEKKFADFPLAALTDRRSRGLFMAWRDELALRSRRQADYAWTVLARVLSWAEDRGLVAANPCARGGRLYRGSRADRVWTADDEANFLAKAPAHLHLPLMLAIWTGQRQGDLLRLTWKAYDGKHIRLRQSKTGVRVGTRSVHHSKPCSTVQPGEAR
jgi:integrase